MSRHRAPATHPRVLTTVAFACAALTGSLLGPGAVVVAASSTGLAHAGSPGSWHHRDGSRDRDGSDDPSSNDRSPRHHRQATPRPLTSGEQQYRNGCLQGYITDDCEQFDTRHLLQRGIDPDLNLEAGAGSSALST